MNPDEIDALNAILDRRPVVVALAGPNGAGKSTFYNAHVRPAGLPFVNADLIAADLRLDPYEAADAADKMRRRLVEQGESFVFETVFSDPAGDKLRFLQEAAAMGYTVALFYIGIRGSDVSERRVTMRVAQGGHDVPAVKLVERYPRILKNLATALQTLPLVWVFDNSDLTHPYRLVARTVNGERSALSDPLPAWLNALWPPLP